MCSLGQKNKKYIHKRDLKTATFQMPTLSPLKNYSGPTADVSWWTVLELQFIYILLWTPTAFHEYYSSQNLRNDGWNLVSTIHKRELKPSEFQMPKIPPQIKISSGPTADEFCGPLFLPSSIMDPLFVDFQLPPLVYGFVAPNHPSFHRFWVVWYSCHAARIHNRENIKWANRISIY